MTMFDSIQSTALRGINAAETALSTATGTDSTDSSKNNDLSLVAQYRNHMVTSLATALPGIADSKEMVHVGWETYKDKSTGDVFKMTEYSSISSLIGSDNVLSQSNASEVDKFVIPKNADKNELAIGENLFLTNMTPDDWKQVLQAKGKSVSDTNAHLPVLDIDGGEHTGAQNNDATGGHVTINGDKHIYTNSDGTTTTQTDNTTVINHDGRTLSLKAQPGIISETIGNRLAFQQDTKNNIEEWNTSQGLKVVKQDGMYKIYDQSNHLVFSRPVDTVKQSFDGLQKVLLSNGETMNRHSTGSALDAETNSTTSPGVQWNVYKDGISRTLNNGEIAGMSISGDAFIKIGNVVITRKADNKYLLTENGATREISSDSEQLKQLGSEVQTAMSLLTRISIDGKLHMGDGKFLTLKNGTVVGGEDQIVDQPVNGPITATLPSAQTKADSALITTNETTTTAALAGGMQDKYDRRSGTDTICDADGNDIVKMQGDNVTTADVVTTSQGTRDRVTNDFIGADGTIQTSNGIKVSANNDVRFADGTTFSHDGTVIDADGRVLAGASAPEAVNQQAASAAVSAQSAADAIAAKISNGTVTISDIAALQACMSNVNSLVSVCMNAGNLEAAQFLMATEASLNGALSSAVACFTSQTTNRASGVLAGNNNVSDRRSGLTQRYFAA